MKESRIPITGAMAGQLRKDNKKQISGISQVPYATLTRDHLLYDTA